MEDEEDVTVKPPKIDVPIPPNLTLGRSGRERKMPLKFSLEAMVALPAVQDAFLDCRGRSYYGGARGHGP